MSGLIGSPSSFNLSDLVDTGSQQSTQLNTSGTRSTASAAAGSAAQLQVQTETHSACEGVTDADPRGMMDMPSGSQKRTGNEPGDSSY